jgi:hypothetical protein
METKLMGGLRTKARLDIVKNLGAVFRRVGVFWPDDFQNCLPSEMFSYGVPYEASKTYRIMKTEFERERCVAIMEAHRQGLRGY